MLKVNRAYKFRIYPHFIQREEGRIKKLHKELSRKKKGSRNWNKARIRLARVYLRLKDMRKDFLHKLSRWLVDLYLFISFEDLRIENMVRNHRLSKAILDSGWGELINYTIYKASSTGGGVVKVGAKYTTQGYYRL